MKSIPVAVKTINNIPEFTDVRVSDSAMIQFFVCFLGVFCVVDRVATDLCSQENELRNFFREMQLLSNLRHGRQPHFCVFESAF
jgi:hypothetical protein